MPQAARISRTYLAADRGVVQPQQPCLVPSRLHDRSPKAERKVFLESAMPQPCVQKSQDLTLRHIAHTSEVWLENDYFVLLCIYFKEYS